MANYHVKVIGTLDQWRALAPAWGALVAHARTVNPFLSQPWLTAWISCFTGSSIEPFLCAVYKDDALIAVAPWCIRRAEQGPFRPRQVEFIGSHETGADYLDVVCRRGQEAAAARALGEFLFSRPRGDWTMLALCDTDPESLFLAHFIAQLEESGKHFSFSQSPYCPELYLGSSVEELTESMSSERKRQLRRDWKKFCEMKDFRFETHSGDSEVLIRAWRDFQPIYHKRWPRERGFYAFIEQYLQNAATGAEDSRVGVRIDVLRQGATVVAGLLHFQVEAPRRSGGSSREWWSYLLAVDRDAVTNLQLLPMLQRSVFECAISEGVDRYRFLKGLEAHKLFWANGGTRTVSLFVPRRSMGAAAQFVHQSAKSLGKILVR